MNLLFAHQLKWNRELFLFRQTHILLTKRLKYIFDSQCYIRSCCDTDYAVFDNIFIAEELIFPLTQEIAKILIDIKLSVRL